MFKLWVLSALVAYASAGIISLDEGYGLGGYGLGGYALAAPKVIAAPAIAVKAGATSYQNSNLLALHPTPVITKAVAAPIAAPIVTKVATPIVTKVAAPITYAAPVSVLSYGHYGLGGLSYGIGKY